MSDSTHARLSPSQRNRWANCPGSVALQEEQPSSEFAQDGSKTHLILEFCLKTKVSPLFLIGNKYLYEGVEFIFDSDRALRVLEAFNYVKERTNDFHPDFTVITESKVSLFGTLGRWDLDGTVDVQIFGPDFIEIVDYKDGHTVVSVNNNLQLQQYAAGVLSQNLKTSVDQFITTIVQPRSVMFNTKSIRSQTYTKDQVMNILEIIEMEARLTDIGEGLLTPGTDQCKYCSFSSKCKPLMMKCLEMFN
jgi:hypothetical protein